MYRLNTDLQAVTFLEKFAIEISQIQIKEPHLYLNKQNIPEIE
jgi:hypothetical protein